LYLTERNKERIDLENKIGFYEHIRRTIHLSNLYYRIKKVTCVSTHNYLNSIKVGGISFKANNSKIYSFFLRLLQSWEP